MQFIALIAFALASSGIDDAPIIYSRALTGNSRLEISCIDTRDRPVEQHEVEQLRPALEPFGFDVDQPGPPANGKRLLATVASPRSSQMVWLKDVALSPPGWRRGAFSVLAADFQEAILVVIYHDTMSIRAEVASPNITGFDLLARPPAQMVDAQQVDLRNMLLDVGQFPKGTKWTATITGRIGDNTLQATLLSVSDSGPQYELRAHLRRTDEGLFWWDVEAPQRATTRPNLR